ncbi:MAG TPA: hypothetical protein VIT44_15445 [Cyclobacteriaceae bacterium]
MNKWYYALAISILAFSSCSKEDDIPPVTSFITTSEFTSYAGDDIEIKLANFDTNKQRLLLNGKEITNYTVTESNAQSTTLTFALPAKIGSGNLSVTDGTTTITGPKVNYQKQYVRLYLSGYGFGYNLTGFKDDKMVSWDFLGKKLNTLRLISVSVEQQSLVACSFGMKSNSITLTGPTSGRYDRLSGIVGDPSGKVHFFQNIVESGVTKSHLFTSDFATTNEYAGGVATGQSTWISDLKLDSKQNLYAVEYQAPYVKRITTTNVSVFAGSAATGHIDASGADARFTSITGLAVDKSDNVFVSDGNCVRMITPAGSVSTLTGGVDAGDKTGLAEEARFNRIAAIAMSSDGTLYLLDNDNGKMKTLSADRKTVTTIKVAGNPDIKGASDDFNIHLTVDSKSNIYYLVKSAPTKGVSLIALINEDNVSEEVLTTARKNSNGVDGKLVIEN